MGGARSAPAALHGVAVGRCLSPPDKSASLKCVYPRGPVSAGGGLHGVQADRHTDPARYEACLILNTNLNSGLLGEEGACTETGESTLTLMNETGRIFLRLMRVHGLAALNTFLPAFYTYHGTEGDRNTQTDFALTASIASSTLFPDEVHDASIVTYVDDLMKFLLVESGLWQDARELNNMTTSSLSEHLGRGGYVRNTGKEEVTPALVFRAENLLFSAASDIMGKVLTTMRHLGPLLDPLGSSHKEVHRRLDFQRGVTDGGLLQ